MTVMNYYSVDGDILGEKTSGGSRIDYLTDALGSVTATLNQSAQVVNTYRYKPYGSQLAKTGTGADPAFGWVGTQGYRKTARKYSDEYVRARHFDTITGRWTTADPLIYRPWHGSFMYADSSPTLHYDPTGLFCQSNDCCTQALIGASRDPINQLRCPGGSWQEASTVSIPILTTNCTQKGTCTNIILALEAVADWCNSACDMSRQPPKPISTPTVPPPKADPVPPADALTICCSQNGVPKFCDYLWCSNFKFFNGDPCISLCLLQHEQEHTRQPACLGTVPTPPGVKNYSAWAECDSYHVQMECLLLQATKKSCPISKDIYKKIDRCRTSSNFGK